ncbi:MAG: hypothetical protein O2968_17880 [Acidobacteria bacterium]|nr:hypothetical protein [Acidobacteriota bacterium]
MLSLIGGLLLASTLGVGGFLLLVFFVKRLLAWLDKHDYIIYYNGHVPTYGSLGNAFMELHQLAEPQKAYVLEMKEDLKKKREEDGEADTHDPGARLSKEDRPSKRIASRRNTL